METRTPPIGIQRLLMLADHLESGKLGHQRFDFEYFNMGDGAAVGCGTAGCALGECPVIFPDEWEWYNANNYSAALPLLKSDTTGDVSDSAASFFQISDLSVSHLFFPGQQRLRIFGGFELSEGVTAAEVAANIRIFCSWYTSHTEEERVAAERPKEAVYHDDDLPF